MGSGRCWRTGEGLLAIEEGLSLRGPQQIPEPEVRALVPLKEAFALMEGHEKLALWNLIPFN